MSAKTKRVIESLSLTGALYGALGFIYIAGNAWFHPESLAWPLTHFVSFPREDTFGAICFGTSMLSCFIYLLVHRNTE